MEWGARSILSELVAMRIKCLKIFGYRGFTNFTITDSNISSLVILAGPNGAGKSTILEVLGYLLTKDDFGPFYDPKFRLGITGEEMIWETTIEVDDAEIDQLAYAIADKDPRYYQENEKIKQKIISDLKQIKKGVYQLTIGLKLGRSDRDPIWYFEENGYKDTKYQIEPPWLQFIKSNQIGLVNYIRPFENLGEMTSTYFNSSYYDPERINIANTDVNLINRRIRSNFNLGGLLNKSAMSDMWQFFREKGGDFTQTQELLSKINYIISPLRIILDEEDVKKGQLAFRFINSKIPKPYPIAFASSGETQVVGLAVLITNWQKQIFKPILLVDEPEIHLHPEYVTRLAELFKEIFTDIEKGSCVVATHSPEFIFSNPYNVYQISADSSRINKVEKLVERGLLLSSMGKKPEMAYLAPKIVFVEGEDNTSNHLSDVEIYQKLVDPEIKNTKFISSNSKPGVKKTTKFYKLLIEELSVKGGALDIVCIVDKDTDKNSKDKIVIITPFTNIENVFLLDIKAITKAFNSLSELKLKESEVEQVFRLVVKGDVLKINGKEVFGKLYGKLKQKTKDQSLSKRALQLQILVNLNKESLPDEVNKFIKQLNP